MAKLYIFGIGGTASRVLKSLTMLLASGVKCDVDTIVPIIIDRDKGNGDLSKTYGLIKSYISVNQYSPKCDSVKKISNRFFNTEIKLLGDELLLRLDDQTRKFRDFIGFSNHSDENKALLNILFNNNTLEMDTEHGFKGHPSIGSVVLNQFDDKNIFKQFARDFQDGDKIFIISSIFGGTGASGFPLLRKMLQTPNVKDSSGMELPNWGLINNSRIGALSVLPYFNVDQKEDVDSDTFNDKARAALSYYENEDGKLDTLYYIADNNRRAYKYAEGGKGQENDAHFVELAAAMSILDFVSNEKSNVNFTTDNYGNRKTTYKEFGINTNAVEVGFQNLSAETQKLIVNPLSRFMLFLKYMGHTIVKKQESGKDTYKAQHYEAFDILAEEAKYQPFAHKMFDNEFRNKITDLETIQLSFLDWLQEMTQQNRRFTPFNLSSPNPFDFVTGNISLFNKTDRRYKNWAAVDNELNRQISKVNRSLSDKSKFVELFYRATEALIDQKDQAVNQANSTFAFRLQQEGNIDLTDTISHWGVSSVYGEKQRAAIKSSNEKSDNQPTSIPTPFARIALTKTALEEVAAYGERALHAYQKIVSDTLDIAEIFFTFDKWKDKIEIIKWDKESDLKKLQNNPILYKTINTFLQTDAEMYNFDDMRAIYIIKHKTSGEFIGATSPRTMFLASGNELQHIHFELGGQKTAFFGIRPLHERNWEFQKYLYTLLRAYDRPRQVDGKTVSIFAEFKNYLESQRISSIANGRSAEDYDISDVHSALSKYKPLRSPDVEILGHDIHYYDFEIMNARGKDYLLIDDILESKIIRLHYKIAEEHFFNGNLNESAQWSFLLPIKEEFFRHFTMNELKKFIRINQSGDVTEVTIKTPEKEYKRAYKKSEGEIIDPNFDFAIFPNIKFKRDESAYYRFGLVTEFDEADKYQLSYHKKGNPNLTLKAIVRNVQNRNYAKCNHYVLEKSNFDYLIVKYQDVQGIIIPSFNHVDNGAKDVKIAIDFGTTSTHIVCEINGLIQSLNITPFDKQINLLSRSDDHAFKYQLIFESDLLPEIIEDKATFKFPIRTALSEATNTDWNNTTFAMAHANIPFDYEIRPNLDYNTITPNLKWSNDRSNKYRIKTYIESLLLILRNKVILNGGDLERCQIVWFYPTSMSRDRFNLFKEEWESTYKKYFSANITNITPMTESIAPYEFYKTSVNGLASMASIDIGGGTTDISIGNGKEVLHIVSFRFAANSIFGNGYASNSHGRSQNGIILQFKKDIEKILTNNEKLSELLNVYNELDKRNDSAEMASFIFSLTNNGEIIEQHLEEKADLNKILRSDGAYKILFLIFYSAIIYHLARILVAKNLSLPRYLTFSGNGSKVVNILSNDTETLTVFTKKIFEKVLNGKKLSELTIFNRESNPKEVTCKGGISSDNRLAYETISNRKIILFEKNKFVTNESYNSIDSEQIIRKTTDEVKEFIELLIEIDKEFSFKNNLGVDIESIDLTKRLLNSDDLLGFTRSGLEAKKAEVDGREKIEETFFFYPLTGLLYDLSIKIYNSRQ
jgi:hypothetical protein